MNFFMLTFVEFEPNAEFPPHKHPHEQITFIIEGEMEFKLGEKTMVSVGAVELSGKERPRCVYVSPPGPQRKTT